MKVGGIGGVGDVSGSRQVLWGNGGREAREGERKVTR